MSPTQATWASNGAGVTTDQRGYITVDDQLQTNVPGIWAWGDCNGRGAFTHTFPITIYEIVADSISLTVTIAGFPTRIQAYALYNRPAAGAMRHDRRRHTEILDDAPSLAKYPMSQVRPSSTKKGETQGFIKICVDAATKQISGCCDSWSRRHDEVIHVLLDVMYAKAPYMVIQRAMHIHPTVAEYLPTILAKLEPFV